LISLTALAQPPIVCFDSAINRYKDKDDAGAISGDDKFILLDLKNADLF
jgi:hypothetical protein